MKNLFVTALLLTGLVAGSANATMITTITGSLDTSPTEAEIFNTDVIGAINLGSNGTGGDGDAVNVTVNSVNFVAVSTAGGAISATVGNATVGQLTVTSANTAAFSGFDAADLAAEDVDLDTLFSSVMIDQTGGGYLFDFTDLQIGTAYTLQVYWASDDQGNRESEIVQGATQVVAWDNGSDGESIATLTFTAIHATESLILRNDATGTGGNDDGILSGFLFAGTPIPEPSSVCLVALGLLGMIGFGRRRK